MPILELVIVGALIVLFILSLIKKIFSWVIHLLLILAIAVLIVVFLTSR